MNNSAHNGGKKDQDPAPAEADLSTRRDQLNQVLDARRKADEASANPRPSSTAGYAQAMKLSSEFIAGIIVGGGMGWLFDRWLGTSPFGLIVFLLLGFAAGVLNVLRAAGYVAEPDARALRAKDRDDKSET
ncbi:ATP synthase protein I [Roseibium hamelinense]|uniref:ATP synthase protein I n=1 Tax=Roseibium hamelinense TaxID=150831 RepID=A0A562T2J7_9HYPH|nr:AtpZ/AtpI family protein [Roseibium hamelinense]MTI42911.1 ATP F0F1 synthase subunit I [Roseibium hamelinense]TWI87653.1 ATP synthase protein I [Roseibium hamelinense]